MSCKRHNTPPIVIMR